jgi:glyoxylase-like metal-dependent hydrolase (beta-lactamase superfamily II)
MHRLTLGDFELIAVSDGTYRLDGGAFFGVVPKVMWEKKVKPDAENYVPVGLNSVVVRTGQQTILIETGIGNKLPERLVKIFGQPAKLLDNLAAAGVSPEDVDIVINTHLHFDHCGQNAVFKHAPSYVQRTELSRMQREAHELYDWFDFMNARFELLDGDAEVLPGLEVITTPGHTVGHQSVLVRGDDGAVDLLIGDAAYTPRVYADPAAGDLPDGQASDLPAWRDSLHRIRSLSPERVHFCHHTDIIHS